jgi:hypothetical protein
MKEIGYLDNSLISLLSVNDHLLRYRAMKELAKNYFDLVHSAFEYMQGILLCTLTIYVLFKQEVNV